MLALGERGLMALGYSFKNRIVDMAPMGRKVELLSCSQIILNNGKHTKSVSFVRLLFFLGEACCAWALFAVRRTVTAHNQYTVVALSASTACRGEDKFIAG